MNKTWRIALVIGSLLLAQPMVSSPVHAQSNAQKSAQLSKAQAAERARQSVKGRVLKVEQSQNTYRVKVLQKSGRVVTVVVDKRTGRVKSAGN